MKKNIEIAQISSFEEVVPPKKYGGTELVVHNLTEELVRRGHKVTLFALGGSKTSAKLIQVYPYSLKVRTMDLKTRESYKLIGVGKILEYIKNHHFDLLHNHIGWRVLAFSSLVDIPMVTTLHGPLNIKYQRLVFGNKKNHPFVSISNSQRRFFPGLNYVATVYNGIKVEDFIFNNDPDDYLAFLGRISPEKGVVQAIKVAKAAREKLLIAAKIDPVDREYWEKKVKPLVDGKQIKFLGELGHKDKVRLLENAKVLLDPINWEEPFGLVMPEAMACGTPVIAPRRASVPEIVVNGKTGFIVSQKHMISEMVKAIKKIDRIKREDCRKHVEKNFTIKKMVDGYEKVYYKILA